MLRQRLMTAVFVASLAAISTGLASGQSADKVLGISFRGQETRQWCWAASGQMIMEFLGATVDIRQCIQACNQFNCSTCCSKPTPENCIAGGWPEFDKYGFSAASSGNALSWKGLVAEIDAGRPVAFAWRWLDNNGLPTNTGHMLVAYGYSTADGMKTVRVWDSLPVGSGEAKDMSYEDFVAGNDYGADYVHWRDYYGIQRDVTPVARGKRRAARMAALAMVAPLEKATATSGVSTSPRKSVAVPMEQAVAQSREAALSTLRKATTTATIMRFDRDTSEKAMPVLASPLPVISLFPSDLLAAPGGESPTAKVNRSLSKPVTSSVLWAVKPTRSAKASTIRAAVETNLEQGKWLGHFRSGSRVRLLMEAQEAFLAANPEAKGQFAAVFLRGLNLDFVSFVPEGRAEALLIPAQDTVIPKGEATPGLELRKGVPMPADRLLERLKPEAARFKGGAPS